MSMARSDEMRKARKWLVPAACLLAAGGYAAVFLTHGNVAAAAWSAGIMLAYGAVLVAFSRRSEVAALLRDTAHDERQVQINLRASALTAYVVILVAIAMTFVELASGREPGAWGVICAVAGLSYLASVVILARRG
jgi:Predicted membrane protein (DUF2178)